MFRLKILTCLLALNSLGTAHELNTLQFSDNDFKLPNVGGRKSKQFSFFSEPEEDNSNERKAEISDPGEYYAKVQQKRRRRKNPAKKRMQGSYSSYKKSANNKLKYAFLKPETYQAKDSKDCKPASPISAFTFMNFAMAAGSVAANIIANVNDNNNNNNNNNNDNNDNSNNFNIENNSNNANNANTIMLPVGRRRKRRRIEQSWRNFRDIFNIGLVNSEARDVLKVCRDLFEDKKGFCENVFNSAGLIGQAFHKGMKNKVCLNLNMKKQ